MTDSSDAEAEPTVQMSGLAGRDQELFLARAVLA